ncbi:MAG: hypothetical protein ABIN48_08025, partial [Ginsengibacter sp.]
DRFGSLRCRDRSQQVSSHKYFIPNGHESWHLKIVHQKSNWRNRIEITNLIKISRPTAVNCAERKFAKDWFW